MTRLSEAQRQTEVDPAWHLMPSDQIDGVLNGACDIGPEFLGFTAVYIALASIIPKHWTVVDLGCAYAPQSLIFGSHKAYVGVDVSGRARFSAPNTQHYTMTIAAFIAEHGINFDQDRTFAICSYIPCWYGQDARDLTRAAFKNAFTFYPASDPENNSFRAMLAGRRALAQEDG